MIIKSTAASTLRFLWRDTACRFQDPAHARQFLSEFRSDPVAMASFRNLLVQRGGLHSPARMTDDEVLRAIAALLGSGDLLAGVEWKSRVSAPVRPGAGDAAPGPAASREPKADEPEPNTFGGDHDAAAQAAALMAAAEQGVPFCEECARAAQGGAH